ncbi:MAG: energy-coupling factor ABC transporter ATP-binding protein [Zhaonellaceae bacterium]|jgi:energy-coupling factor transporter ATP-binding protein EcfA2
MSKPFISVQNVHFAYPDGTKALFGVDLDIYPGEIIALVGQNGSGKTTLVKHFNGLLKPTEGDVLVDGVSVRKQAMGQLARRVGYVYQNPSLQLFSQSVKKEVAFGLKLLNLPEKEIDETVDEVLNIVGLYDKKGFYNKCWGNKRGKQEKKKNKRAYPKTKPVINPYHTRRYIGYAL